MRRALFAAALIATSPVYAAGKNDSVALALDEVRFLPCRISPHKTDARPASGEDRFEMLSLATVDLPWAVVDDFELYQPAPSFSYQTAEAMVDRFPDSRLFWIMGGDQWDALPQWRHPELLADCVEFIVLARGELGPVGPSGREDDLFGGLAAG